MATTVEGKIARALYNRTVALATAMQLPLSWLGYDFTTPPNRKFLRAEHRPNLTERQHINSDGPHRYVGFVMIAVHAPHGSGKLDLDEEAGKVVAHFPCDLPIVLDDIEIRITERPSTPDFIKDDADMFEVVEVQYEAYA